MLKELTMSTIKGYKKLSSLWFVVPIPFTSSMCKYQPTCGDYAIQAIEKHGVLKGATKAVIRVAKCNPLSRGGVDLP